MAEDKTAQYGVISSYDESGGTGKERSERKDPDKDYAQNDHDYDPDDDFNRFDGECDLALHRLERSDDLESKLREEPQGRKLW